MKTRLVSLNYRGSASVDPRYSAAMLPWTINDIRSTENYTKLSVGIENGFLEAYNSDFELQFSHPLKHIVGMCRIINRTSGGKQVGNGFLQIRNPQQQTTNGSYSNGSSGSNLKVSMKTSNSYGSLSASLGQREQQLQQQHQSHHNTVGDYSNDHNDIPNNFMEFTGPITGLVYLMKEPKDPLLHVFLFECEAVEEMAELMHQMRDPAHTLGGSVGSIPQTLMSNNGTTPDLSIQKALASHGIAHITPATNIQLNEAIRTGCQNGLNANLKSNIMKSSKSYTQGLSNSAGTVHIPTSTSAQGNLSLLADISPNHTHFFEVMYVGKIRVSHKRVPFSFIDDALPKFKAFDAQRALLMQMSACNRKTSLNSEATFVGHSGIEGIKNIPIKESKVKEEDEENAENNKDKCVITDKKEENNATIPESIKVPNNNDSPRNKLRRGISHMEILGKTAKQKPIDVTKGENSEYCLEQSVYQVQHTDNTPKIRDRSASYGCIPPYVEQNRTMVFLVGRSDLRLISPDRKQVLLYKDFKDVASCAQGQKNTDHFGVICREAHGDGYIGYVFKCQSEHVCDDIVAAISQAFITCAQQKRKESTQIFSCEHCPMLWYHKLCSDVEGLNEKKTQNMIFRRIESLTDDEQDTLWAKFHGSEKLNAPLAEQNQFLMMLLRAHCESRQQRHVHDTLESRSEFINQYLGGNTIFMKAKRSLTNSFDHLLNRRTSKDDTTLNAKIRENAVEGTKTCIETYADDHQSRLNTMGLSPSKATANQLKSPMMDIFLKVGNCPQGSEAVHGSWRQAILNSVVTPPKTLENFDQSKLLSPMCLTQCKTGKRTRQELRELWKSATHQIILLRRMETENAMLQARQNENELKRMKLDYDDMSKADKQLTEQWEHFLESTHDSYETNIIRNTIMLGVPRLKRGEVWLYLAEQYNTKTKVSIDTEKFPNFNTPYHVLLKSLTEHQHAIFIDLGRTFPNHKFYKDPLGLGQLSLFNLLKAYSILDPELGYCQGLGFLCGVLLLHCDEAEAFHLLKHLMFHREMRCKYLPDMKKFQLQLYQLSRLVKDHLPELYIWLDQNDVSPTLYAAPWILTVFSSQFPLGFVARVFDLLFLDSSEVIFKFALSLLSIHKQQLLLRNNFEEIMDYFKNVIPKINCTDMEKITTMAFSLNLTEELMEYNVEYNVLQEEIQTANHHLDLLNKEKTISQHLEQQLQFAQSSVVQLEKTLNAQESNITTLQNQVQSLEISVQTLGSYLNKLKENGTILEIPGDVQRILQQLDDINKQKRKALFTERKIGKSVSVNSHLGFPLKALEELNEKDEHGSPQKLKKEKTPFFEHKRQEQQDRHFLYGEKVLPQQRPRTLCGTGMLNEFNSYTENDFKLPEVVERYTMNIKIPQEVDSGIGTPLSPPSSSSSNYSQSSSSSIGSRLDDKCTPIIEHIKESNLLNSSLTKENNSPLKMTENVKIVKCDDTNKVGFDFEKAEHPLSMVNGVHVNFKGTTQLKSWRPMHHIKNNQLITTNIINDTTNSINHDKLETDTLTDMIIPKSNDLIGHVPIVVSSSSAHS